MSRILEKTPIKKVFELVQPEMAELEDRLLNKVSADSGMLKSIIQMVFNAGGKRIRPIISFLVFKALSQGKLSEEATEKVFLSAEIAELIHTASLVHDDIIDNSLIRRGSETLNSKLNNAITVISGDFLFARAAVNLGKLDCNEIVCLYANVLQELCDGEIIQVEKKYSTEVDWEYYFKKNYKKTSSLIEAAAKAPACVLFQAGSVDEKTKNAMANYGRYLGDAFQIIDDVLDYTSDAETLGKPVGSDLKDGQITAPVLYALEEGFEELKKIIPELASDETKLDEALNIIKASNGIQKSLDKAEELVNKAKAELEVLPASEFKVALTNLAEYVVSRNK